MARPTKYTKELAAEICARLIDGDSLRTVCSDDDMPAASSVFLWLSKYEEFSEQYAHAKEESCRALAEEIMDISDDGTNDWMERFDKQGESLGWSLNGEHVQRSKLRVDSRKWLLSKLMPKKYGDKLDLQHGGNIYLVDGRDS